MTSPKDKFLDKDPFIYLQERERFMKDLHQFHTNRGTAFLSAPTFSGKTVDLYLLYSKVIKLGGFHKVSDKNLWMTLQPELFHLPQGCVHAELALKELYMRYLYVYERVNVHGDDPDQPEDEEGAEVTRGGKGGRILVHQVASSYNYRQHRVDRASRAQLGLSTHCALENEYERLEKSLMSGLTNEVNFALNICLILSVEGRNSLRLLSHQRMIEILLAHVGLFSVNSSLSQLHKHVTPSQEELAKFWYTTTDHRSRAYGSVLRAMISEGCIHSDDALLSDNIESPISHILNMGREPAAKDPIFHKVLMIASILRNLSCDAANAQALASNSVAFGFAALCAHSRLPQVKQAGLDTLTNMAFKIILEAEFEKSTQLLFGSISAWLHSEDKQELVNALLLLSALAQVEQNEEVLVEFLNSEMYSDIVSAARINDLQMITASLDAMYFLSEIGEGPCEGISTVKYSIDFLIDLVTIETQSLGESALIGTKVLEHGGVPAVHPDSAWQQQRLAMTQMGPPMQQSMPSAMHTPVASVPGPSPVILRPQQRLIRPPIPIAQSQYKAIQPKPPPGSPASGQVSQTSKVLPTLIPATPHNIATMNPEQVVCNWLRANYEPCPGALVISAVLQRDFGVWLQRLGAQFAPLSPVQFMACLNLVFPQSEIGQNGSETLISGIRWRPPQNAQVFSTPGSNSQVQQQTINHNHTLFGGDNASSFLISNQQSSQKRVTDTPCTPTPVLGSPITVPRLISPPQGSPSQNNSGFGAQRLLHDSPRTTDSPQSVCSQNTRSSSRHSTKRGRLTKSSKSGASPRSSGSPMGSPLPPGSPRTLELQICGEAELVEDTLSGALAKIQRVENTSPSLAKSGLASIDGPTKKRHKSQIIPPPMQNGCVDSPPSTTLSSPTMCNGNHSDNDSLSVEPNTASKPQNGVNGLPPSLKKQPMVQRNGCIKGLERIVNDLDSECLNSKGARSHLSDRRRNASGGSEASTSTTSTQYSDSNDTISRCQNSPKSSVNKLSDCPVPTNQLTAPLIPSSIIQPSPPDLGRTGMNSLPGADFKLHNGDISIPQLSYPINHSEVIGHSEKLKDSCTSGDFTFKDGTSDQIPTSDRDCPSQGPLYRCCWSGCTATFHKTSHVRTHVSETHTQREGACGWAGCDNIVRKRWALVGHVIERHVSDKALDCGAGAHQPPAGSTAPPIYAPQAARMAVLRTAPKPPYPELMDSREGPVTKHLRFTASLVLRNIARYSPHGRTILKKHESHLAFIAGSGMEAAGTIINCLWELQQHL